MAHLATGDPAEFFDTRSRGPALVNFRVPLPHLDRDATPPGGDAMERPCDSCGTSYMAKRPTSRFCSPRCRMRASRAGQSTPQTPAAPPRIPENAPSVVDATMDALRQASRLNSPMGAAAVALATRIDAGLDTGSALAAAVKALDETLAKAVGAEAAAAPVSKMDEIKARRDAKRRSA